MAFLDSLRYSLLALPRGFKHYKNILRMTNVRFSCTKNKILGWKNGHPSYNLLTPLVWSSHSAYALASKVMTLYQWRTLPETVNIAISDKCACSCEYCSFTSMKKEDKPVLTLDEWRKVIKQVQRLGASTISLTGGEPLESPDIMEIIKSVNPDFSQVIMFTSGYLLEEKAAELAKSGLTSVIVSLNSADADKHDKTKKHPGIYEKVIRGIKAAQKAKLLVGIAAVVYKEDLTNGNIVSLIECAKKLKVNQLIFFDAIPAGCYNDNTEVVWSEEDIDELIRVCSMYHEKKNYPGILPYSFLNSYRSIGCYAGTVYFYISPYGDACPCDFCSFSVGNVREQSVYAIWEKFREYGEFASSSLSGCKMKNKSFREKFL